MKLIDVLVSTKAKKIYNKILDWLISALVGALVTTLFTEHFKLSLIFFIILFFMVLIYIFVSNKICVKFDIISILNKDASSKKWIQVIRLGYPLSRPLHLSGRYNLRQVIGNYVFEACEQLDNKKIIRIDDKNIYISEIKAKTLIDDLGWTAYQLGKTEIAIEKINQGINIAEDNMHLVLAVKGYRHLLGILDSKNDYTGRDKAETNARKIIQSQEYKDLFANDNEYIHNVAEFDYAYAKTLIDDKPEDALSIGNRVQEIFHSEITNDMDRYVKTYDLIGDIYACYNRPDKLKTAKETYLKGLSFCEQYSRTERYIRISIDYINLLIKMKSSDTSIYNKDEWNQISKEEKQIFFNANNYTKSAENKAYQKKLQKLHKQYIKQKIR